MYDEVVFGKEPYEIVLFDNRVLRLITHALFHRALFHKDLIMYRALFKNSQKM